MKEDDYMNQGQVMETADRKLMHYISSASRHLMLAEYYTTLGKYSYYEERREEWQDMVRLYKQLANADIVAAVVFVSDLEDVGLLDYDDWANIHHILMWFGIPAEDR